MKKRILILAAVLISLTALTSCSTLHRVETNDNYITTLIGRSEADIVMSLGAPTSSYAYEGGHVITYYAPESIFRYEKGYGLHPTLDLYISPAGTCINAKVHNSTPVRTYSPTKTLWLLVALDWLEWLTWWW